MSNTNMMSKKESGLLKSLETEKNERRNNKNVNIEKIKLESSTENKTKYI